MWIGDYIGEEVVWWSVRCFQDRLIRQRRTYPAKQTVSIMILHVWFHPRMAATCGVNVGAEWYRLLRFNMGLSGLISSGSTSLPSESTANWADFRDGGTWISVCSLNPGDLVDDMELSRVSEVCKQLNTKSRHSTRRQSPKLSRPIKCLAMKIAIPYEILRCNWPFIVGL